MPTLRKIREFWTETKRIVIDTDGEPQVKQTTCCCAAPGGTRRECSEAHVVPRKTRCRCDCHSKTL